ncbi:GntR family transcriptional regulator [Helcobacillus massiliensis]
MPMSDSPFVPVEVPIEIDKSSPIPLYLQLAQSIQGAIDRGELAPGDRIENEVSLSRRLGVARPTVRQGIQELVDKGMLVRKRGVGTQVVESHVNRPMALTSLYDDLRESGKNPTTDVLEYRIAPADRQTASRLLLEEGAHVLELTRLRRIDGRPLALMRNVLPVEYAPSHAELSTTGLYDALREKGAKTAVAHERIGAVAATAEEAEVLGEEDGAPLLFMERKSFMDNGHALEYGYHLYRPSLYAFEVTLVNR